MVMEFATEYFWSEGGQEKGLLSCSTAACVFCAVQHCAQPWGGIFVMPEDQNNVRQLWPVQMMKEKQPLKVKICSL
jgi:hypothetical protein